VTGRCHIRGKESDMKSEKAEKILCYVLGAVFLLSIIPILTMGFYARPLWDDFDSSAGLHLMIEKGDYLGALLQPIVWAKNMYYDWQGTYAAEILFAIQPGAWPLPAYWITPFVIVLSVSISTILFWTTVSECVMGSKKIYGMIIAFATLTMQFQYVPQIHQAFYWWNGTIYYSFFYALFLFEIAAVIRMVMGESPFSRKKVILSALLAFFVSGGNYSTALVNILVLSLIMIYVSVMKKKDRKKQGFPVLCVAVLGLVISMIAPGNMQRAAETVSMSPVKAVLTSLSYGLKTIKNWSHIQQIGTMLLCVPFLYLMVKNTKVRFRFPLVALVLMFGLYCSQMTPPFYAVSYAGDWRQIDMYYYSYYLLMTGCLLYLVGWFVEKFKDRVKIRESFFVTLVIVSLLAIVSGVVIDGYYSVNSYKISADIAKGRAAQYDKEYEAIIDTIRKSDGVCYVQDINQWTNSLDKLYIDKDPDYWCNLSLAEYYGADTVCLAEE